MENPRHQRKKQAFACIEVSLEPHFKNVYYHTECADLDSLATTLALNLAPQTRYYLRITVTSDIGETATSEVSYFETAKQDETWNAHWIETVDQDKFHPEFIKRFYLKK